MSGGSPPWPDGPPDAPAQVVRRAYAAFAARDLDALRALLDDAVVVEQTPAIPWGGSWRGKHGVDELYGVLWGHIDARAVPQEVFEAGSECVVLGRSQGTALATGRPFDARFVHVWSVRDGRITAYRPYVDTPAMLDVMGLAGDAGRPA